jgi:LysM repeat protein
MPKLILILTVITFFVSLFQPVYAQDENITKSTIIEVVQGKKYYIHEVKKGETIYGISKAYQVSADAIAYENPDVFNGIKPGDKLRIPIQATPYETKIHTVQKGETLYGIAKKYNTTIEEIVQKNPEVSNGIKIGQKLTIPIRTVSSADYTDNKTNKENKPIQQTNTTVKENKTTNETNTTAEKETKPNASKHVVQKGETLYGITKQYNVSEETLYKFNPDLKANGLKVGQEIIIKSETIKATNSNTITKTTNNPDTATKKKSKQYLVTVAESISATKTSETQIKEQNCNTTLPPMRTIKVALFIPLQNDAASLDDEDASTDLNFKPASKPYLEYYEGFLMALDTIRKQGLGVELLQYEVKHDSSKIKQILNEKAIQDVDLIIGPFQEDIFGLVAFWAEKKHINIIDPINSSNHSLYNFTNVFQLNTGLNSQLEQESRYLASFDSINMVMIKGSNNDESQIISVFKKKYLTEFKQNFPQKQVSFKEINYNQANEDGIEKVLDKNSTNVIVLPSSSQVFVINVITKLNNLTKNYKLILTYMPLWKKFEQNFELEHIFNLHAHVTHPFYINYGDSNVRKFILDYRFLYKIEPSKFSFLGFDSGIYFLSLVQKYGKQFQSCVNQCNISLLSSRFYFEKAGVKGGYENKGVFITHYNENSNDVTIANIITDKITLPLLLPQIELRKVGVNQK